MWFLWISEENITKAASEVAQAIGGNVKQTEAELLSKVLGKINQTSTTLRYFLLFVSCLQLCSQCITASSPDSK